MKRTASVFLSIFMMALISSGCLVAESKYLKKADEATELTGKVASLEKENKDLKDQVQTLNEQNEDLTQKVANLEENLSRVSKKTKEVEKASSAYQELLAAMKGEIAQGQITIKELKGKLTMNVVDKILFASGETKVKQEGLDVLSRVVEILKTVKDKNIRVEGHTDNIQITSRLARVYPTNWELSAARAINVSRYLEQEGIDPKILSATAFGEYQPVADNATPEGRAKNRRIAIILLPKD